MSVNKTVFKVGELEFASRKPTPPEQQQSQVVFHRTWKKCATSGDYILRTKLFDVLRKNDMWNDEKDAELKVVNDHLADIEKRLAAGGIRLEEARKLALELSAERDKKEQLLIPYVNYDEHTVEAQAQNAQFDFLCSLCIVDNNTGKPVFSSPDDYQNRKEEEAAMVGAKNLMNLLHPDTVDWRKKLPEYRFLLKYKFVNENLRLINKEGQLVDEDGRFVDETGHYIKYVDGVKILVNRQGDPVDDQGDPIVESKPFLDENDNPIAVEAAA